MAAAVAGKSASGDESEESSDGGIQAGDPKKLQEIFRLFREMVLRAQGNTAQGVQPVAGAVSASSASASALGPRSPSSGDFTRSPEYTRMQQTISAQKQQIATQNHEINTLVCILRDREKAAKVSGSGSGTAGSQQQQQQQSAPPSRQSHDAGGLALGGGGSGSSGVSGMHAMSATDYLSSNASSSASLSSTGGFIMGSLRAASPIAGGHHAPPPPPPPPLTAQLSAAQLNALNAVSAASSSSSSSSSSSMSAASAAGGAASSDSALGDASGLDHTRWLVERNAAFDEFKRTHRKSQV